MKFTTQINHLRNKSGVYALIKDKEIVYVGSSINMHTRALEHKVDGVIIFDEISTVELPDFKDNFVIQKMVEMGVICELIPNQNKIMFENFTLWLYSLPHENIDKKTAQKIKQIRDTVLTKILKGGHNEY